MTFLRHHLRLLTVAVCSVAVGAGASAIAVASASSGSSGSHAAHHGRRALLAKRLAARAVQGSAVVWTKSGFRTVSFERGVVDSVSSQQLTLTEGTPEHSYNKVTETIPSNAVVRDNRAKTTLGALTPGERVLVVQGPNRTFVRAHTAQRSGASTGTAAG